MKKKIQIVDIVDQSENRNENIKKKSNKSIEWSTPADLYNELDQEFHFEYDLCATPQNAKAENKNGRVLVLPIRLMAED